MTDHADSIVGAAYPQSPDIPKPPDNGRCGHCDAELPIFKDARKARKFCSSSCGVKYRRAKLREMGICPVCGSKPPEEDKSMCGDCRRYQETIRAKRKLGLAPPQKSTYIPVGDRGLVPTKDAPEMLDDEDDDFVPNQVEHDFFRIRPTPRELVAMGVSMKRQAALLVGRAGKASVYDRINE